MAIYSRNTATGALLTLASGQRLWIGTKAAKASEEAAGTMPNNCLVAITDDFSSGAELVASSIDLNTLTSQGTFYCNDTDTCTNKPDTALYNWILKVDVAGSRIFQTFTSGNSVYNAATPYQYIRVYGIASNTWSAWRAL